MLGLLRDRAHAGDCRSLLITHKFREVMAYADDVSVLRRGRLVPRTRVAETGAGAAGRGDGRRAPSDAAARARCAPAGASASRGAARAADRRAGGRRRPRRAGRARAEPRRCSAGEIVGIAGVSGNGQRELVRGAGRPAARVGGSVQVTASAYAATRAQNRALKVRSLPEEPLRNACVGELSVGREHGAARLRRRAAPRARLAALAARCASGRAS